MRSWQGGGRAAFRVFENASDGRGDESGIAVLSQGFTLRPGDVIATGTPEGVGAALGKFLKVGEKLETEVEKIVVLQNRVVAPM